MARCQITSKRERVDGGFPIYPFSFQSPFVSTGRIDDKPSQVFDWMHSQNELEEQARHVPFQTAYGRTHSSIQLKVSTPESIPDGNWRWEGQVGDRLGCQCLLNQRVKQVVILYCIDAR